MRRITSLFVPKKDSDTQTSTSSKESRRKTFSINTALNVPTREPTHTSHALSTSPETPQLRHDSFASAHSSTSSSAGLRTPEDELLSHPPLTKGSTRSKKSLFSWLPNKKSEVERSPMPNWRLSQSTPKLQLPSESRLNEAPRPFVPVVVSSPSSISVSFPTIRTPPESPKRLEAAKTRLEIITRNSLVTTAHSSPCHRSLGAPSFPRSGHMAHSLPVVETLESSLHRRRVLHELRHSHPHDLTAIVTFADRPCPPALTPTSTSEVDESRPNPDRVSLTNSNLEWWLSRPCFEGRNVVWFMGEGQFVSRPVSGTHFGVPELEFSPWIEHIAGAMEVSPGSSAAAPKPPPISVTVSLPASSNLRHSSLAGQPSPLRQGHPPLQATKSLPSLDSTTQTQETPKPSEMSVSPTAKRGVRFAEDDMEDQVPLGYVIRMRQRKAQKAQFLQEEREARRFAREKARMDEERRRREQEREEWERERSAWEAERRRAEEEKKNRLLAQEVQLTRSRRESQRAGFFGRASNTGNPWVLGPSTSSTSIDDMKERTRHASDARAHSRPTYNASSRRSATDSAVPRLTQHSPSPASSDSRASSVADQSPSHSRPPSMHSTPMSSIEDVRPPNRKRRSMAASDRSSGYFPPSTWPAVPQNVMMMPTGSTQNVMIIPYVPAMPGYLVPMDHSQMPLVPPTPPFFGESRSRSRSRHSSSSSRNSGNGSSESLNQIPQTQKRRSSTYSNASRSSSHLPPSPQASSTQQWPNHQRRLSGDIPQRPTDRGSGYATVGSRSGVRGQSSRPPQQHPSAPSPWTGLPSKRDFTPLT